jgi:hypothetical protein
VATEPFVYEARYSWNVRTGRLIVGALVFVVLGVVLPLSLAIRIADFVLFGGGGLFMLGVVSSRRVAFRVDSRGITLGGTPPSYRSGTRFVPWSDIEQVVLWRQTIYASSVPYVGLVRREGAARLAGRKGQLLGKITARVATPRRISGDTLLASRAINSWRMDNARLVASVAHFAPNVEVVT